MAEPTGPFKIILTELEQPGPDVLGNPAAERARIELARMFNLDDQMASNIVSAVPIIVLDGLDGRTATVVRERLQVLAHAGCKVVTTDDPSDTIPRVNWPELPAIAHVSADERGGGGAVSSDSARPVGGLQNGTFHCPSCRNAFQLVPAGGGAGGGSGSGSYTAPPPTLQPETRARNFQTQETLPRQQDPAASHDDDDDWMNPPVSQIKPVEAAPKAGSARFDNASLLAYHQAEAPSRPPPPPPPQPDQLQVAFSDSSEDLQPLASGSSAKRQDYEPDPFAPEPDPFGGMDDGSSFEPTGTLDDSGSDILNLDPPHRHKEPAPAGFHDDLNLLDEGSNRRGPSLDDLELLEDSSPAHVKVGARTPSSEPFDLLDSDDVAAAPRAGRGSRRGGGGGEDLDDVLRMFGPEDENPLDDMAGLEPQPLDLNPAPRRERSRPATGRGDPFADDEVSDILEPLNPSEAMEIIKSQKGRGRGRAGGGGASQFESLSANEEDSLDIFGESNLPARSSTKKKKKKQTRGVPFSASDEDLALFEESNRPRSSRSSRGTTRKKTDPFARARRAMEDEARDDSGGGGGGGGRRGATDNGRGSRKSRSKTGKVKKREATKSRSSRRGAPAGEGNHGLVLSRISDPDKKDKAAELIAEIKGCALSDAQRLTERTIIPVLKGVSREVAEFHLDKFKRYKIAGRVTTRQRS